MQAKGVFLNCPPANCSIYESGVMFYKALAGDEGYLLEYKTIRRFEDIPGGYDFYFFNYHHVTMSWLDTDRIGDLPGFRATFVLEMLPGDPFVYCPDVFDAYCVPDPTMKSPDPRVYAFPRPLEVVEDLPGFVDPGIPVIGSFGFATQGKGFETVVWAVNKEYEKAVIRLNIPPATFADADGREAARMAALCKAMAKPGVEVLVSHDYLSKEELIRWCATNTINVFLYDRKQPGLAATTDQAVTAGRPLLVSPCDTFRHIHPYIRPYPGLSIRDAVLETREKVLQMRRDWHPSRFQERFKRVLADAGLLASGSRVVLPAGESPGERPVSGYPVEIPSASPAGEGGPGGRGRVLLVSHRQESCGIHQFGKNLAEALGLSKKREYVYVECSGPAELLQAVERYEPEAILYNYYPLTMPWVSGALLHEIPVPHVGIVHEVTQAVADHACRDVFDYYVAPDPSLETENPLVFKTSRVIQFFRGRIEESVRPTIGSFGFGFGDKGFAELAARVKEEFPSGVLRLHIPFSEFVDPEGKEARKRVEECRKILDGSGIRLEVSHQFLDKEGLLTFLAGNSLNAFLYDRNKKRGISSVLDYALGVDRPVALTDCPMFRHLGKTLPLVSVDHRSLREILEAGTAPLEPFKRAWTPERTAAEYDEIFDRIAEDRRGWAARPGKEAAPVFPLGEPSHSCSPGGEGVFTRGEGASPSPAATAVAPAPVCLTSGFNRILDDRARRELAPLVERLFELAPETMARKIPRANVQQAFVLDVVEHLASRFPDPRILCAGCYEDTAYEALVKLGYEVTGIDPVLNRDLETFYRDEPGLEGRFHVVFATSVLEHVRHDGLFLMRVSDLLAPGGFAVFTVDFKEGFRPGDPMPREDYRLYTKEDILEHLLPLVPELELLDEPRWDCPEPDFHYGGVDYTFATLTLRKKFP